VAESLAASIGKHSIAGASVLLVRAAAARAFLPEWLRERGAKVEVVEAYRTSAAPNLEERARELESHPPDWITFTSSSTVDAFFSAVDAGKLGASRLASIGPVTSATLGKNGLAAAVEASEHTVEGMLRAILAEYNR
jgi:uroporphyrinogen-III synthase